MDRGFVSPVKMVLRAAPQRCGPEDSFATLFRNTSEVLHRGDYNIPWGLSEAVGKFSDLLDQIIGEAQEFGLFWW